MKQTQPSGYSFAVNVPAEPRYDVIYRPDLLAECGAMWREVLPAPNSRVVVLSDDRVFGIYGEEMMTSVRRAGLEVEVLLIPPGEKSKSLPMFIKLLDDLSALPMDRRGLLVNFGGGVVSDLGGFVASAYMRGISYANFSTSLIGQLDAAVGGKVAVNTKHAKNLIGSFHHPVQVAGDPVMLRTLSSRDFRSGMAEAIKIAIIDSPSLFGFMEESVTELRERQSEALMKVVGRASELKMEWVSRDPYEQDLRRPLNFGHTLGHPIETEFAYANVRHGEAVAVGMAVATMISLNRGVLGATDGERILGLLRSYDLIGCAPAIHAEAVVEHLRYIKLVRGNRLHFVLPVSIGEVMITEDVGNGELLSAFAQYSQLCVGEVG